MQAFRGASKPSTLGTTQIEFNISISDGFCKNPEEARLARLGCKILAEERYRGLGSGTLIWSRLLPQLSNAIPSVNAAVAALGAIYEAIFLTSTFASTSKRRAAIQYGRAIHHVQQDLSSQLHGPIPLLLSCALLAFAEVLQRRQYHALMHLQGALRVLHARNECLTKARLPPYVGVNGLGTTDASATGLEDNLSLMFMTLDIQKASYALGQSPDLSSSHDRHLQDVSLKMENINEAELQLVRVIHSCYHFTSRASEFKYLSRAAIPSDLVFEQGRHIAKLSLWLHTLNQDFLSIPPGPNHKLSSDTYHHALVLRTQCLSTLIYLSTILNSHECSYDLHAPRFQQIIQDTTTILAHDSGASSPLRHFRPSPGIVQPLFLTATKYRHTFWRRQAIDLLRRAGREGPFDGKLLAAVASRAVEIEEGECTHRLPVAERILPEHVAEVERVHGCGMDAEAKDEEEMRYATVMFSRCRDVDQMVDGAECWDHEINWIIWDESVLF